jgi:SAM-dependent methyltransferase
MFEEFDIDYYENGIETKKSCYEDYKWLPELTIPMAHEFILDLGIEREDKILDFGCAKGYLVKAFLLLHYDCDGVDVSKYAIENADEMVKDRVKLIESADDIEKRYDVIIAKDVLEHIDHKDIKSVLDTLHYKSDRFLAIIPLGDDGKYRAKENDYDVTHKICENEMWWIDQFRDSGFRVDYLSTKMDNIKTKYDNEIASFGFFTLKGGYTNDR